MRLVVALVVGACSLFAACAAPGAPAAPRTEATPAVAEPRAAAAPAAAAASPRAPEPVKLGYASLSVANAGLFTAADGGMFERNGLEPELILMGAGQTSEAGLLSGQIPAVSASPISALNAVLGGGDVVVVGAVLDLVTYQIIGGPEVAALADLRGKTIAINRLGGSPHSALRLMMATGGVDLDREVQVLQAGAQLERIAAVRNGAAQATLVEPPFAQQAASDGLRLVADSADMRIVYPITALNVNRQWLETEHDTARRLLQSVVDGTRAFRTDKELGIRTLQHWFKVDDPALLEATYAYFSPMLPDYVLPATEGIQRVIDEIPSEQLGGRRITADDLVDPSLAREIR
jgi:ABC-type nitrate/sulfonate/bicarbonate transport system substrate-binding protein